METSVKTTLEEDILSLSHEDLCEISLSTLRRLIHSDKLLSDLPADVTIEEVNSQIAIVHGQSITVHILRQQETTLNVVIPQATCTVRELKRAIQRAFSLRQQRSRSRGKISWRYVWRTYQLRHGTEEMSDDRALVSAYGVVNKSRIRFVHRMRKKQRVGDRLLVSCVEYPWYEQVFRQDILSANCDMLNLSKLIPTISHLDHILVDHKHKLLYCYVPKVACTNWKRILMVLTGQFNTTDLSTIPASLVHAPGSLLRLSEMDENKAYECLQNYTRFIMVRHPFERLLSAYKNKLQGNMASAKYFQARIGRYIVKKYRLNASSDSLVQGDDVTFREFVQYLITDGDSNENKNEHWEPIYQLCYPCSMNYTFIGKYERLLEDSELILNMLNASDIRFPMSRPSNTHVKMKKYFAQLSLREMEALYKLYKNDFMLFGYDLSDILGYDIG